MLIFSTKIPVYNDMTEEEFINLCAEWAYNSPFYHNIEINYNLESKEDYFVNKENISCIISYYKDKNADIISFRLINVEDMSDTWTMDILFICEENRKFISIQNNLDSKKL